MLRRKPSAVSGVVGTVVADTAAAVSIAEVVCTAQVIGPAGAARSVGTRAVGSVAISRGSAYHELLASKFVGGRHVLPTNCQGGRRGHRPVGVMLHRGHHAAKIVESRVRTRVGKMQPW